MLLMNDHGELTDAGVEWIQQNDAEHGSTRNEDEIKEIFNPNTNFYRSEFSDAQTRQRERLRNRWRENIILAEAIGFLEAEPRRITSGGDLVSNGRPTEGIFVNSGNSAIVFANRTFITIFADILRVNAIPVTEQNFILDVQRNNDLRNWSMVRYLVYTLRTGNSESQPDNLLKRAYLDAHLHYLSARLQDPLRLLTIEDVAQARAHARPAGFDIRDFQRIGSRTGQDSSVPNHALAVAWFKFLFTTYDTSSDRRDGNGFIANEYQLRNDVVQHVFRDRRSTGDEADFVENIKLVKNKKPDIIQIFPARKHIDVIDATFRFDWPWHNFKTELYCSVLRTIFNNGAEEAEDQWTVSGFDYKALRYVTRTS